MAHRVQGNTSVFWLITEVVIKDTDEQPDEKVRRARSWRVFGTAFVPLEQSVLPFRQECVHQPTSFLNLLCNPVVVGALACRHSSFYWVIIHSPDSPPLGMKVGAESFKLLIMAWSFWWPPPIPNLYRDPQSPHIFLAHKKTYHSGDSKGLRRSFIRKWV